MPFPGNERFAKVRIARLWLWPLGGAILLIAAMLLARGSASPSFVLVAYATYGLFLLAALRSLREAEIPADEIFGLPPGEVTAWLHVILLVPVMFLFAAMSLWATAYVASWVAPAFAEYLFEQQDDPGPFRDMGKPGSALLILFVVVVGPVVEEFVFRGVILRRWIARAGFWRGVIGSSLVFALLHPPFWIGAMVVGVFLSVLYLVTRSLYAPIAFHAMYNGLVTFATIGAQGLPDDGEKTTVASFRAEWMAETALLLVSAWVIFRSIASFAREAKARPESGATPPPTTPTTPAA